MSRPPPPARPRCSRASRWSRGSARGPGPTSSSAASCGRPGSSTSSLTARPKRPLPSAPMSTWAVTVAPSTTASALPSRRGGGHDRAGEAGGVAGGEELLGVRPLAAVAAHATRARRAGGRACRRRCGCARSGGPLRRRWRWRCKGSSCPPAWRTGSSQEPHRQRGDTPAVNATAPLPPRARRRRRAQHRRRHLDGPALPGLRRSSRPAPAPTRSPRSTAFRPHLIVLDVMLPDMEGFEVAERLGAAARRACRSSS